METLPFEIHYIIFSKIDNYSKHLVSNYFRKISILSMTFKECRKRSVYNINNCNFLILLSQNPNSHIRKRKFKNGKWKMEVSCLENIFNIYSQNNSSFSIDIQNLLSHSTIPSLIYDKLLEIACSWRHKDIVLKLLKTGNVTDASNSFMISYDRKYFDIVKILFETNLLNFEFNKEQSKVFKEIFIDSNYKDQDLNIFETESYKECLLYYTYSMGDSKLISKIKELLPSYDHALFVNMYEFMKCGMNDGILNLWICRELKSLSIFWCVYSYNRSSKRNINILPMYVAFLEEEISLFEYMVNKNTEKNDENNKRLLVFLSHNNEYKIYKELLKDKRFEVKYTDCLDDAFLEVWDAFIFNKDIRHRISLSNYFTDIIKVIENRNKELVSYIQKLINYINKIIK